MNSNNSSTVKGYKAFYPDWSCGFLRAEPKHYTCPGEFKEDVTPEHGRAGMHFCENILDCFMYYPASRRTHIAEVAAKGRIAGSGNGHSYCTDHLEIIREVTWDEIEILLNSSRETALEAMEKSPDLIRFIKDPDEGIQLAAVKKSGLSVRLIKNPTKKAQLEAVKENPFAIRFINSPDEEVCLAAKKEICEGIDEWSGILNIHKKGGTPETPSSERTACRYRTNNDRMGAVNLHWLEAEYLFENQTPEE